jgi:hypothetical protein
MSIIIYKHKPMSEETKKKISIANKGKHRSEETKQKLREIRLKQIFTKEDYKKISEAIKLQHRLGLRKHIYKRISESKLGHKVSKEARNKISKAFKGKTYEEIMGKEKAKERRLKLSKRFTKEGNPFFNKKHKEQTLEIFRTMPRPTGKDHHMFGKTGKLAPNWLGGKSFEPYTKDFNKIFKLFIKERDNFTCLKCNILEIDAKILYKQGLHIHHIDYIKENTFKENCCALCTRCNLEVNYNRESWTRFFQSLLNERYGYKYTKDNEPIISIEEFK